MQLLFEIAAVSTAGLSGFAAGWWYRYGRSASVTNSSPRTLLDEPPNEPPAGQQKAKHLLTQVHALTARVAAQLGEHHVRVQEINNELISADGSNLEAIMASVSRLVEANSAMQEQLESAEKKMEDQSRTIDCYLTQARTDALTGIYNRRAFDEELERCHEEHLTETLSTCVMMIDVDYFKKFNDTHGHKAGDEVLRAVAKQLKETALKEHIVCRYGGEEFAILLRGESIPGAIRAAERTRSAISALNIDFEGKILKVTASAGLAELIGDEPGERAVARADAALYCSKKAGRNQGHYHDGEGFKPFVAHATEYLRGIAQRKTEDELQECARGVAPEGLDLTSADRQSAPVAGPLEAWDTGRSPTAEGAGTRGVWETTQPQAAAGGIAGVWKTGQQTSGASHERDPVTGLSTHAAFYEDLEQRLEAWKQGGQGLSVVMVQVDGWSKIVRKQGEEAGEIALKAFARLLQASVRELDHLARYDDDSFAVLLPTADYENALSISRRLQQALARCQLNYRGDPLPLSASIGITSAQSTDIASRLMQRVTAAQNNASNRGGQRIYIHDGARLQLAEWQTAV